MSHLGVGIAGWESWCKESERNAAHQCRCLFCHRQAMLWEGLLVAPVLKPEHQLYIFTSHALSSSSCYKIPLVLCFCVPRAQGPCSHDKEFRRQDSLNSLLPLCPSETPLTLSSLIPTILSACVSTLVHFSSIISRVRPPLCPLVWGKALPLQCERLEWCLHTHGFHLFTPCSCLAFPGSGTTSVLINATTGLPRNPYTIRPHHSGNQSQLQSTFLHNLLAAKDEIKFSFLKWVLWRQNGHPHLLASSPMQSE